MRQPPPSLHTPAWIEVRLKLQDLQAAVARQECTPLDVAKGFASLANAMLVAMESGGTPSMRFRAVSKALNLATPKSQLERFLADP